MSVVLFSGGLDSAVLLALERTDHDPVWPVHVRSGLAWEDAERRAIDRLLSAAPFAGRIRPVTSLSIDLGDVYSPSHWAITGQPPAYDTPDEDVYLPGRNIVLISKAAVLSARIGERRLAMGTLSNNPFPDATPEFFSTMARAMTLGLGLGDPFLVAAPLVKYHKEDVVRLGVKLGVPFELTISCMNPAGDRHCGQCSKCRERIDAFRIAGVADPTEYASVWEGSKSEV